MMKKVLLVTDDLFRGGAQRQLVLLAKNLRPHWEPFIWSLDKGPYLAQIIDAELDFKISQRRFRFDISPVIDLILVVNSFKPNIIHSWGWMSTLSAIPISKMYKIPLVNGIIRSGKPYYYRGSISKYLSNWGDIVISNSQAGLINWEISRSRGVVINNGFDKMRLVNTGNVVEERNNDNFTVVMTGRMVKAKDFSLFISAARKMVEMDLQNIKFLAIGKGEDRELLINSNIDLVKKGILEFPEVGIETIHYLKSCDVGVLLTKSIYHGEGCSNSIMEYMACALPVIATNNGGNTELVENISTGFIIPDGDVNELINKLLWLFQHPNEARIMGGNGRKRLFCHYSIESMIQKTIDVYDSLLSSLVSGN